MCGYVVQLKKYHIPSKFDAAIRAVEHRGIRTKVEMSPGGAFAHARLPIVGTGEEHDQPVRRYTSAGNWTIGFVGEILDFRDLARNRGEAECDLYTVTRSFLSSGPSGLRERDGFWSVAALRDDQTLMVYCDYLAQKPTYYRQDRGAVASEIDALVALAPTHPDEMYMSAVIKWGYCPEGDRTPHAEIKKIRPGECVTLTADGAPRRSVVDPLYPLTAPLHVLRDEITAAVRRRVLSSDVPVAALVSGGLDSSIVYALARQYSNSVVPYVATTQMTTEEQLRVSWLVRGAKPVEVDWTDAVHPFEAARIMQEPVDLGSLVPQIVLARAVRERVCLTGDGADEVFGGYGRSERYDSQYSDVFHELPCWHLPRLDRVMMRHRIEVRSPFLARRVVQMGLALPWELRRDKIVLRQMFKDVLPPSITQSPKIPLRTNAVEQDREARSIDMVSNYRRLYWPATFASNIERIAHA